MLPNVDYSILEDNVFGANIVDLEFAVMTNLRVFVEKFKDILLKETMIQTPELIVAHLYGYLGFLVSSPEIKAHTKLYPKVLEILEHEANYAYTKFSTYPVYFENPHKSDNLQKMRSTTYGSIVAQTLRLGRVIFDTLNELNDNHRYKNITSMGKKQTELFCPQDTFLKLLITTTTENINELKDELFDDVNIIMYAINQTAIQIGWIAGYFAYLDKASSCKTYLEYLPCTKLYMEFGCKLKGLETEFLKRM